MATRKPTQSRTPARGPRSRPTVVLAHPLLPEVREVLEPHCEVILAPTRPALRRSLPSADALLSIVDIPIDEEVLSWGPQLRVVGNMAVGVNNIDLEACKRRGIRVINTPKVLTRATAEIALALLLAASKRMPEGEALCRSGRFKGWAPDMLLGLELKGRNAVLLGKGRIGQETAKLFRAIGLKVEWITRADSEKQIREKLTRAQIFSIHVPLTRDTRHWLNKSRITLLPEDSIVINTARGPIIDEMALIEALHDRRIFAAGLDVYEYEPEIPAGLRRLPNAVLLPHLGSATRETRSAMARLAATGILGVLIGKRPWNEVKMP